MDDLDAAARVKEIERRKAMIAETLEIRSFAYPPLLDPELQAISILNELLEDLSLGVRRRVLAYANDKHGR